MFKCFLFITLLGGKTSLTFFWDWNDCSVGLEIAASLSFIHTSAIDLSKALGKEANNNNNKKTLYSVSFQLFSVY